MKSVLVLYIIRYTCALSINLVNYLVTYNFTGQNCTHIDVSHPLMGDDDKNYLDVTINCTDLILVMLESLSWLACALRYISV